MPKGTNIVVRGGAAASDDAWNLTIRVFASGTNYTAVIEMDEIHREHYNYPKGYSGVKDVTADFFPEVAKYELTEEEKKLAKEDKIEAIKTFRTRVQCDISTAKQAVENWWWTHRYQDD